MKDNIKNSAETLPLPVVLVAPLDWGLGHATRCIPLIKTLISLDYEVIIAAEGAQAQILEQEFPSLKCVYLPGYRLRYADSGWKTTLKILTQIPKILIAIKSEKRWLHAFLQEHRVNLVISDNRYGLYNDRVNTLFITHQLQILAGFNRWGEGILRKIHYHFIRCFSECWVPDYAGPVNLAGRLSHPSSFPSIPVRYTGPLTRLHPESVPFTNELLILLSGPEPQRTILENILLEQLQDHQGAVVMVRGLPAEKRSLTGFNQVRMHNHLSSEEMNELVNSSHIVLSRSGYSTVMDMLTLRKKCIFIPTPGQTEQEYLAAYLAGGGHCLSYSQQRFSLSAALNDMSNTILEPLQATNPDPYTQWIKALLR